MPVRRPKIRHHDTSLPFCSRGCPADAGMHPGIAWCLDRMEGLPRRRGDAPFLHVGEPVLFGVAPQTRGCTPRPPVIGRQSGGCPADAGMHPPSRRRPPTLLGLPRRRGDAPRAITDRASVHVVAPQTRGCTPGGAQRRAGGRGCPADAGMHLMAVQEADAIAGLPRRRGDAPAIARLQKASVQVAPQTRGCTSPNPKTTVDTEGCPADAGMHPSGRRPPCHHARLPRRRGDAPVEDIALSGATWVAPQTRGCTFRAPASVVRRGGCPADAGMHPHSARSPVTSPGLPRRRGDAPICAYLIHRRPTVAPQTRGCTSGRRVGREGLIGCPADAGMHRC